MNGVTNENSTCTKYIAFFIIRNILFKANKYINFKSKLTLKFTISSNLLPLIFCMKQNQRNFWLLVPLDDYSSFSLLFFSNLKIRLIHSWKLLYFWDQWEDHLCIVMRPRLLMNFRLRYCFPLPGCTVQVFLLQPFW